MTLSVLRKYLKPKTNKRNYLFSEPHTAFQIRASKNLRIPLYRFPTPNNSKYLKKMMILLHPNKNPKRRLNAEVYFKRLRPS